MKCIVIGPFNIVYLLRLAFNFIVTIIILLLDTAPSNFNLI